MKTWLSAEIFGEAVWESFGVALMPFTCMLIGMNIGRVINAWWYNAILIAYLVLWSIAVVVAYRRAVEARLRRRLILALGWAQHRKRFG